VITLDPRLFQFFESASTSPSYPDYWHYPDLFELHNLCFIAATSYPTLVTEYNLDLYIEARSLPPSPQRTARLNHLAHVINNCIRLHANYLRGHLIRAAVGHTNPEALAQSYQHYRDTFPVPPWP
jgi:hypothetical protein